MERTGRRATRDGPRLPVDRRGAAGHAGARWSGFASTPAKRSCRCRSGRAARETWTLIPTFAERRMAAGAADLAAARDGIRRAIGRRRRDVQDHERGRSVAARARTARRLRVSSTASNERRSAPPRIAKFDDPPYFDQVFAGRRCGGVPRPLEICNPEQTVGEPNHRWSHRQIRQNMPSVTIVGAGVAGLTIAYQLVSPGTTTSP